MDATKCRWGIMGTAGIARKNWKAIWNAENATLAAVASRSVPRAEQFIRECQSFVPFDPAPRPLGSYEELLAARDIDAVYIPLPTGIRKEWAIRAAEAGKHVLAEKPVGVHSDDVAEIIAACRKNNVQFMDGVMFMHSERLQRMRAVLDDGQTVGRIRRIASQFSFCAPEEFMQGNIRVHGGLEPLGCLGDLGWYNVRFSLWAMNYQMPRQVSGRMLAEAARPDSPQRVPLEFSGELLFDGGASASFYCSFQTEHQQWAYVTGTNGYLHLPDFVLSFFGSEAAFETTRNVFCQRGSDFNMEEHTQRHAVAEYSNSMPNSQETNLFRTFSRLALSKQPDEHWSRIALQTQQVLDACLESARNGGRLVDLKS